MWPARWGTSQPYVAKLEAGTYEPKLSTFLLYAGIVAGAFFLVRIVRDLGQPIQHKAHTLYMRF